RVTKSGSWHSPISAFGATWFFVSRSPPARRNSGEFRYRLDFHHVFVSSHRHDKNFAVSHSSRAGHGDDLANDLLGPRVVVPEHNFDLGKESERILRVAVLI